LAVSCEDVACVYAVALQPVDAGHSDGTGDHTANAPALTTVRDSTVIELQPFKFA
jgi:hypothetical protein